MKLPVTILGLLLSLTSFSQKKENFIPKNLKIDWQLVSNNYQDKDQFLATFTLTNTSTTDALPASGWVIYYNFNRDVVDKNAGFGLETERVHGDLFHLRPTAQFKGLAAGASITLNVVCESWAFNISDAPAGYYLVWDNAPAQSFAIPQTTALPPTDLAKFLRHGQQKNDQITPQMVYEQNSQITDIPEKDLVKVFPTPVSYRETGGTFVIDRRTSATGDQSFGKELAYLNKEMGAFLKGQFNTKDSPNNLISMRLNTKLAPEAYELTVRKDGVEMVASTPKGMFYAIQSLKSLFPTDVWRQAAESIEIPCVEIKDAPRFGYRGVHMDVARNFQSKAQVMRMLNWMAMYKLNTLHFHFSDDEAWRIEIPALPELTTVGVQRGHTLDSKNNVPATYGSGGDINNPQSGFYTRQDYIEILRHAKALYIEVIPEIETPGHARAAIKAMNARYERLLAAGKTQEANAYLLADFNDKSVYRSAQNFRDNVMCVALPSVYTFIETTVDALVDMHREAGMPLKTIHMGGDEVPGGVWEKSPLCQDLMKKMNYTSTGDLWVYYWEKVQAIAQQRNLYISGWEEIGMRSVKKDDRYSMDVYPPFAKNNFHTYVWNTVIGWGTEDLPYRLANLGYKVVLCPVSNLYFDLAYQKDFNEPGYYWGGFCDVDKPFYFIPLDYLKNAKVDRFGNPIDPAVLKGKEQLTEAGKANIVGIQGHLWSENIHNAEELEYLAFPKILGLAERAWAPDPEWATTKDAAQGDILYQKAWSKFANTLGKRELKKLNYYQSGANFRIPTVGLKLINDNGGGFNVPEPNNGANLSLWANVQFPGLTIRYTTDGSEPTMNSAVYTRPIAPKGNYRFRAFDSRGRGGRTVSFTN